MVDAEVINILIISIYACMYLAIGNKIFHAGIGSFLSRVIAQGGHRFYMWRRHSRVAQPLMRTLLLEQQHNAGHGADGCHEKEMQEISRRLHLEEEPPPLLVISAPCVEGIASVAG